MATFALSCVAPTALAQSTSVITNPSWSERPEPEDMADAYPWFASWVGFDGVVVAECSVVVAGRLGNCDIVSAAPGGLGFDRAALSVMPRFRLNPRMVDGEATKSRVRFRLVFSMADDPPAPAWAGRDPSPEQIATVRSVLAKGANGYSSLDLINDIDLDVDADRQAAVGQMLIKVDSEFRDRELSSAALAMARLLTPEEVQELAKGRLPSREPPSDAEMISASGEQELLRREIEARLRALYCETYGCAGSP